MGFSTLHGISSFPLSCHGAGRPDRPGNYRLAMGEAPTGTVTFLFTDIEGSTRLWQVAPAVMPDCLARHDDLLRSAFARHGGKVFATGGDGFAVAFARAADAIEAARDVLEALDGEAWPPGAEIRVRIGIHTGEATERDGDYFGSAVNRTARLMALAHGGQALCSATTLGIVEEPPPTLDLGEHRLRDLLTPVHVHQLGTRPFPPLRSDAVVPTNLPTPPTDLIGRDTEVSALVDELARHRLVTVTGVGGMGKTRLAVEVAGSVASEFPDGVWFVDLAPAIEPGDVVRSVAAAMGATAAAASGETLVAHLEGRVTLLVLDNCEHVIDAVADLAAAVIAASSGATMLATSREPLDVAGEFVRHLRPLGLPEAAAYGAELLDAPAVRLFEERARAARAGFSVGDDNVEDVIEICRRLDGVPLAIELAAARAGSMSTGDIRARLGERFRLLAGSRRGHERHRTLQATVAWSYDLLDPDEQRVFRRLSVFAGRFGLADVTAVVGDDGADEFEVLDQVTRLTERSLVVHDGETGRYRLLETLRQFGEDRLVEAGEAEEIREQFVAHYCALAHREGPRTYGADYREARASINDAFDCIRATAELLGTAGRWPELAALATSLWLYTNQEAPAEAVAWVRPLLATDTDVDPQVRYDALWAAASAALVAGYVEEAFALDERTRQLVAQHPEVRESAWAYQATVTMATFDHDPDALAGCEEMLDRARRYCDSYAAIYARSLALNAVPLDDPGLDDSIERCVADAGELGSAVWVGTATANGSQALIRHGAPEPNVRRLLDLLDRYPEWRDGGTVVRVTTEIGRAVALTATDPAAAIAAASECTRACDRAGLGQIVAGAVHAAAAAALRLGSTDHGARLYRHALATFPSESLDWLRRDIAVMLAEAGFDDAALTPQALSRAELFDTMAELEQRHPPTGI